MPISTQVCVLWLSDKEHIWLVLNLVGIAKETIAVAAAAHPLAIIFYYCHLFLWPKNTLKNPPLQSLIHIGVSIICNGNFLMSSR